MAMTMADRKVDKMVDWMVVRWGLQQAAELAAH